MNLERPVFGPPSGQDLQFGKRYSRWALWGCLVLVLAALLLLGGYVLVLFRDPAVLRSYENVAQCQARLEEVSGALDRYSRDKGHLPARLEDLYPTYLADGINLRCPADLKFRGGTSYELRPGAKWGGGEGVVVYCLHHPAPNALRSRARMRGMMIIPVILEDGHVDRQVTTLDEFRASLGRARR